MVSLLVVRPLARNHSGRCAVIPRAIPPPLLPLAMNQHHDTSRPGDASGEAGRSSFTGRAAEKAFEEFKLAGNQLVDRVRSLVEEGNVRRIVVKKDDRVLLEVPLTVAAGAGAAVVLLSPVLAALGALAALLTDVTLLVEREPGATGGPTETPASKPVTDVEGKQQARGEGGDAEKTIGR